MGEAWIGCANCRRQEIDNSVVWQRQNESVGSLFPASIENCGSKCAVFKTQASYRRAQDDFPALFFDGRAAAVVKFGEWDRRNTHAVAGPIGEKCLPKNVDAEAGVGTVELFIEGTNQDHAPETLNGAGSLFVTLQPSQHG